MPISSPDKKTASSTRAPSRNEILETLNEDFQLLVTAQREGTHAEGEEEFGLADYFHAAARVALPWIGGDPYRVKFPEGYTGRLVKLCAYLRSLKDAEAEAIKVARENEVARLRSAWTTYRAECTNLADVGTPREFGLLGFTWDGVTNSWTTPEGIEEPDGGPYLPAFTNPSSEAFHLAVLGVLFLNRAAKYRLTDLTHYAPHRVPTNGQGM